MRKYWGVSVVYFLFKMNLSHAYMYMVETKIMYAF